MTNAVGRAVIQQGGLFRHYWVLFKLLLTILATVVLLSNMQTVSDLAGVAAGTGSFGLGGWGQLLHSEDGLLVLLVTTILSVYKPQGMIPYRQRNS